MTKSTCIRMLVLVITAFSCNYEQEEAITYEESDGIYFEVLDTTTDISINPYNQDNKIYRPGLEFTYDYVYIDTLGNRHKFKREGYELTPEDSMTERTISEISIKVEQGLRSFGASYNQTEAEYRYYLPSQEIIYPRFSSGIVENEKNIWMHPFRTPCYFRLLQLSPFPFIQAPFEIGNKWDWSLGTGNHYDCAAWGTWEGNVESVYKYEILREEKLSSPMGVLNCYVVKATGEGRLGNTALLAYFNEEYGFIYLEYLTVNGSKMILELKEVNNS